MRMKLIGAVCFCVALPYGAHAQSANEEIIVTARKRNESILKVPVIGNIVSSEMVERSQITDVITLTTKIPGLSMGNAVLSIGPQISLRGVGTSTLDSGVDQSVSLNVDGLSMTQGLAFKASVFDLAQAEVLKGPQSLFFGKNSPGGVISLRTADPGDRFELIGSLAYEAEARQPRAELIVSGPLSTTFGMRLAATVSHSDGYFKNKATPAPGSGAIATGKRRVPNTDSYIVRATAVWNPASNFDARLKVNFAGDKTRGDASHNQLVYCPDGTGAVPGSPPLGVPYIHPNDNCEADRTLYFVGMDSRAFPGIRNNGIPFFDLRQKFGTLELNYRPIENVTITSVSGYYRADLDSMINSTSSGFAAPSLAADNDFYREDITQEVRVDTSFSSPLNFTIGGFYQDGTISNKVSLIGNTAIGRPASVLQGSHKLSIKSYSAFGQLRWKPTETIELAGGVRWTDEKRSDTAFNRTLRVAVPKISSNNLSPEFTLTYTPTEDLTLFGSLKQGYKSGSYTITVPVNPGQDNSFGDEKVQGGELGLKSRLMDRQLRLNLAGYYYIYKGLQVGANEPAQNGIPIIRTLNAGKAKVYGIDFDFVYSPDATPGLSLNGAINWNHARFTRLDNVPCYGGQTIAAGCDQLPNPNTGLFTSQDLSGTRLVRAPDWQATVGANYETTISDSHKVVLGIDAQYSSRYPTNLSLRPQRYQKGYALLNANVSFGATDESWQLSLIGNNITNKITYGSCTNLNYANSNLGGLITGGTGVGPAGTDEINCNMRPGRELWLRLTLRPMGRH